MSILAHAEMQCRYDALCLRYRAATSSMLVAILALSVVGCGSSGPALGTVTGTVTMDGQPLAGVMVTFQPTDGRSSIGTTDSEGNYELSYTREDMGALVGDHKVLINWPSDSPSAEGNPIPAQYNTESELSETVKTGSNSIDFALTSQ